MYRSIVCVLPAQSALATLETRGCWGWRGRGVFSPGLTLRTVCLSILSFLISGNFRFRSSLAANAAKKRKRRVRVFPSSFLLPPFPFSKTRIGPKAKSCRRRIPIETVALAQRNGSVVDASGVARSVDLPQSTPENLGRKKMGGGGRLIILVSASCQNGLDGKMFFCCCCCCFK